MNATLCDNCRREVPYPDGWGLRVPLGLAQRRTQPGVYLVGQPRFDFCSQQCLFRWVEEFLAKPEYDPAELAV